MAKMETNLKVCNNKRMKLSVSDKFSIKELIYKLVMLLFVLILWQLAANHYNNSLLLPTPKSTIIAFFQCITDIEVITNISITMTRVLKGFLYALLFGVPIGFLMGAFKVFENLIGGFIDSLRQVPIMAWVPLTIVWFGIGDGPTIFLIAFAGVFPVILNTIHGVKNISKDYYNAAKSMGASPLSIFVNIMVPAAIPDILTGARIAISSGWMSVI